MSHPDPALYLRVLRLCNPRAITDLQLDDRSPVDNFGSMALSLFCNLVKLELHTLKAPFVPVLGLSRLTHLYLFSLKCSPSAISSIVENPTQLTSLRIDCETAQRNDFAYLNTLTNLKSLKMFFTTETLTNSNFEKLCTSLTKLKTLTIHTFHHYSPKLMVNVTKLSKLTKLHACGIPASYIPLVRLTTLRSLDLYTCITRDRDLATIATLTRLTSLSLDCGAITDAGIPTLATMQSLRSLALYNGANFTDLGHLRIIAMGTDPNLEIFFDYLEMTPLTERAAARCANIVIEQTEEFPADYDPQEFVPKPIRDMPFPACAILSKRFPHLA